MRTIKNMQFTSFLSCMSKFRKVLLTHAFVSKSSSENALMSYKRIYLKDVTYKFIAPTIFKKTPQYTFNTIDCFYIYLTLT